MVDWVELAVLISFMVAMTESVGLKLWFRRRDCERVFLVRKDKKHTIRIFSGPELVTSFFPQRGREVNG
jgi:hypothetical protein